MATLPGASPVITARYMLVHQAPALLAILGIAAVYTLIARDSRLGSGVLLPVIIGTLALLRFTATWRGHQRLERQLAIILLGALTLAETMVTLLIMHDILDTSTRLTDVSPATAQLFLRDALLVWIMNILVFSLWYWELDGAGPTQRRVQGYRSRDLAFPESEPPSSPVATASWQPHYVDYLFVAFTTSTTFGPGDASVISLRGKLLTMVQTLISMALLTVVIAWGLSVL